MPPMQNPQLPNGFPGQPQQPSQPVQPLPDQPGLAPQQALPSQQGQQPRQPVIPQVANQPEARRPMLEYTQPQPNAYQPGQQQPLHVTQPAAPAAASPYDFFLDPQNAPKKKPLGRGMSGFTKIVLGAGGFFVLLIILAFVLSAARSSKDTSGTGLVAIAQQQQEIIRVSTLAQPNLDADSLKNFVVTSISASTSAQQDLISYAAKHGSNIGSGQLALGKNAQTDQVLTAALSASTYDATFKSTMQQLLTKYQATIQKTRDASTVEATRNLLDTDLTSATLLTRMLNQ